MNVEGCSHEGWGWNVGIGGDPSWNYSSLSMLLKIAMEMLVPGMFPSQEGSFGNNRMLP